MRVVLVMVATVFLVALLATPAHATTLLRY